MARKPRSKPAADAEALGPEIAFEFIKSGLFRVVSVDGAFGGISPQGRSIHMAVFSERRPLPTRTVHRLQPNGQLGEESLDRRESRAGFVREIEADLVMDLHTAVAVRSWLDARIAELIAMATERSEASAEGGDNAAANDQLH